MGRHLWQCSTETHHVPLRKGHLSALQEILRAAAKLQQNPVVSNKQAQ